MSLTEQEYAAAKAEAERLGISLTEVLRRYDQSRAMQFIGFIDAL